MRLDGPLPPTADKPIWCAPRSDLSDLGYVVEEFFLSGFATRYQPVGTVSPHLSGEWDLVAAGTAAFCTRLLVVRPQEKENFNGMVCLAWQNVTSGYEVGSCDAELLRGSAWIGVSAQCQGIESSDPNASRTLKRWDPLRYAELIHPGDAYSYSIFARAADAVRRNLESGGGNPLLGDLQARWVVGYGWSQSAARMTTFLSDFHRESRLDGYMLGGSFGVAATFDERDPFEADPRPYSPIPENLEAPVFVVNGETEAYDFWHVRRPDSRRFCYWEVAGAPHIVARAPPAGLEGADRNDLTLAPVQSTAWRHMHTWLSRDLTPPGAPPLEFEQDRFRLRRDDTGNVMGGLRLPPVAEPCRAYHGISPGRGLATLFGYIRDLEPGAVTARYGTYETYAAQYLAALTGSIATGHLREEDRPWFEAYLADSWAKAVSVPS